MKYFLKTQPNEQQYPLEELIQIRNKIIAHVYSYYSKLSSVNSILLVGSKQGKPQDHYSDLDFFIFYESESPSKQMRKKFIDSVQSQDEHIFVFDDHSYEYGISDAFEVNSVEVCQTFYQIEPTKKQVKSVFSGFYRKIGFYYPMAIVAAIAEGEIIYAKDSFINELKIKCSNYPAFLRNLVIQEELPMINYYLSRIYLAIFRNDKLYFDDLIYQATDSVLQVLFAINNTYFYSRKALQIKIDKLEYKPENIFKDISFLLEETITLATMKQKQHLLKSLTKKLYDHVNLESPILFSSALGKEDVHPCAQYFFERQNKAAIVA